MFGAPTTDPASTVNVEETGTTMAPQGEVTISDDKGTIRTTSILAKEGFKDRSLEELRCIDRRLKREGKIDFPEPER